MRDRRLRLVVAGVLLASPLLASCGFEYSTDKVNSISSGTNDRDGEVDVLGAVVITGEPGSGVFAATLVNNSTTDADGLESLDPSVDLEPAEPLAEAIPVAPAGHVNLFQSGGIDVTGKFEPGDVVSVQLTFTNGQVSVVDDVPVVTPCRQYSPEKLTALDITIDEAETEDGAPSKYSCENLEPVEHAEGGEEAPEEGEEPVE